MRRQDYRWLLASSVLWVLLKKAQQSDSEDLLRPAPAGAPDPQEDDGDQVTREVQTNDLKEVVNKL